MSFTCLVVGRPHPFHIENQNSCLSTWIKELRICWPSRNDSFADMFYGGSLFFGKQRAWHVSAQYILRQIRTSFLGNWRDFWRRWNGTLTLLRINSTDSTKWVWSIFEQSWQYRPFLLYLPLEPDDDPSCPAPTDDGMTNVAQHDLSAATSSAIFSQSISQRPPCRRKPPQGSRSFWNFCQRFFLWLPGLCFQFGRGCKWRHRGLLFQLAIVVCVPEISVVFVLWLLRRGPSRDNAFEPQRLRYETIGWPVVCGSCSDGRILLVNVFLWPLKVKFHWHACRQLPCRCSSSFWC